MTDKNNNFKSGFVALIGRPNVGKSTFLNRVLGQKIAIMSDKPQTTRNKIQGVYTTDDAQMIFLDTPGVHKPKNKLDTFMDETTFSALRDVDVILFMVNADEKLGLGDQYIIHKLNNLHIPVYLIINKVDKISPNELLPMVDKYKKEFDWEEVFPISALKGNNVNELLDSLQDHLPKGPLYYPKDQVVNQPERFIVAELIREKILQLTHQEIPHAVAVEIDSMKEPAQDSDKKVEIEASIIVERDGQKGILIGHNGEMLKKIGTLARKEIEAMLGNKVYLKLWIKVRPKWRNNSNSLKQLGYKKSR